MKVTLSEEELRTQESFKTDIYALHSLQEAFLHPKNSPSISEDFSAILEHYPDHVLCMREFLRLAAKSGDFSVVEEIFNDFLEKKPTYQYLFLEWLDNLPKEIREKRDFSEILQQIEENSVITPLLRYHQALEELKYGNGKAARGYLEEALELHSNFRAALVLLIKLQYDSGDFEAVVSSFDSDQTLPRDLSLFRIEGVSLLVTGQILKAKRIFESILLTIPADIQALFRLAEIEERRKRSWKADQYYNQIVSKQLGLPATEDSTTNAEEKTLQALTWLILNDSLRAEQGLRNILHQDSNNLQATFLLGIVQLTENKTTLARDTLETVFAKDPLTIRRELRLLPLRDALLLDFLTNLRENNSPLQPIIEEYLSQQQ